MNAIVIEFQGESKPVLIDTRQDYGTIMNSICTLFGFKFHHQVALQKDTIWDSNILYTNLNDGIHLQLVFIDMSLSPKEANDITMTRLQDSLEYHQFYNYFIDSGGFFALQELVLSKPLEPCVRALATCLEKHPELRVTRETVELMLELQEYMSPISLHALRVLLCSFSDTIAERYTLKEYQTWLLVMMNTQKPTQQLLLLSFIFKLLEHSNSPVDLYQDLVYKGLHDIMSEWDRSDAILGSLMKLEGWIKRYYKMQINTPVDTLYETDRLYYTTIGLLVKGTELKEFESLGLFALERLYELIFKHQDYFETFFDKQSTLKIQFPLVKISCELFHFLNAWFEVCGDATMDHPLFLCYERVYFLGMKLFIDLWTLLLPCGDSELLFVGNTCFFYLEKLLRSSNNIKEFVDLMSLDVQTIRNQYLDFQVQKKRYSSRPAAQRIQKSVQEQLPTVFYNMAVHYLTIGHWFDAKPGGSIFIQLQESEFWYGYFHVRNPHIVKLQDISIKETQVKTLTLIHSDDLVSFTVDSFQSDEKWVQMVFIVLGVEVGRQQLEFMDTVARQLIHLQLMSEILSQSL